jgi:tRNA nucleotidyltransferase/poly(A) polymerase
MNRKITLPQLEFNLLREVLSFIDDDAGHEIWLVGGSIRDLVAGYRTIPDLDLAVSFDPVPLVRHYARKKNAGFVVLDEERQVVRVVKTIKGHHYVIDLARFRADNIEADLRARDFTINAMAARIHPDQQSPELEVYDPLNGYEHLKHKMVVPCSDELFRDDPLRIMRAFRFAAIFNADFSAELLEKVKLESHLLEQVSGERIRDELFKVLAVKNSAAWIRLMQTSGVLPAFLKELSDCQGIDQNEWHHLDVFDHSLLALQNLEELLVTPHDFPWWKNFLAYLHEPISGSRNFLQSLKFGTLIHDLGKPSCKKENADDGRVIFHGHEMEGVYMCKAIVERLRLSVNELHFLQKVVKNHMRPGVILQQGISDRRLFNYYCETGRDGLGIALLSLADRLAALGNMSKDELTEFSSGIFSLMQAFYEQMKKPKRPPLLTGADLIAVFSLKPGPLFKDILAAVAESQFLGEIGNRDEAIEFVNTNFLNK